MDKVYVAILSLPFLLLLHYILGKFSNGRKQAGTAAQRPPPTPPSIPFLGHVYLVSKPFHTSLCRLAARLGPVFTLRLGSRRAVVVSSAQGARECFTEHDVTFANRPSFPSSELVFPGNLLATANHGPHLRHLRSVSAVQLLSAHRVDCMSGVIAAEVRAMVRRLCHAAAVDGGAARVQLNRRLFELSLSVLMETIARTKGTRPEEDDERDTADMSVEGQELKEAVEEIMAILGTANMWDYLPVMRWLDVFGVRNTILKSVRRMDAFMRRLIDTERRRLADVGGEGGDKQKSMIAVLLNLQKTEPELYTASMITGLCANLFAAGTDTTSITTEWAMSLLLNHPAALRKARAEVDATVGTSRLVSADDARSLPYLQCIISETLRLYPASPLLLPHQSSAHSVVCGYDVPADTMLIVNAYAIHRDPAVWEDPLEFRPERFLDGKADALFMIPFGMGRRRCPGEALALHTIRIVLATMLQCFDWELVDQTTEVDMAEGGGITMTKAVPLEAVCRPRTVMRDLLHSL